MIHACAHGRSHIDKSKRRRFPEVPIRRFGQDIEEIPLVSHGRSGGGIQIGIGGKAAQGTR